MNMYRLYNARGFTLIELMVVVLIIGILTLIALPNYQRHLTDTRRESAQSCLLELAQFAERHYTTNMSYEGLVLPTTSCVINLSDFYTFSINGVTNARSYSIQALALGVQAVRDTDCVTLRINQTGLKTSLPNGNSCW